MGSDLGTVAADAVADIWYESVVDGSGAGGRATTEDDAEGGAVDELAVGAGWKGGGCVW